MDSAGRACRALDLNLNNIKIPQTKQNRYTVEEELRGLEGRTEGKQGAPDLDLSEAKTALSRYILQASVQKFGDPVNKLGQHKLTHDLYGYKDTLTPQGWI